MAKSNHGMKIRAGKLLSAYLRQIAEEETEFIKSKDGNEDRMVTKVEALARKMWAMALGYTETRVVIKNGVPEETEIEHYPDKGMMAQLTDRLEGRAPLSVTSGAGKMSAAKKVTEQGQKRINKILDD